MSTTCERCYRVVQRPCTEPERDTCPHLQRMREQGLPKTIQRDGPLTRLRKANERKDK